VDKRQPSFPATPATALERRGVVGASIIQKRRLLFRPFPVLAPAPTIALPFIENSLQFCLAQLKRVLLVTRSLGFDRFGRITPDRLETPHRIRLIFHIPHFAVTIGESAISQNILLWRIFTQTPGKASLSLFAIRLSRITQRSTYNGTVEAGNWRWTIPNETFRTI